MKLVKLGFYTVAEVAEMLGVKDRKTLYNWERAKKIPKARRHPMNNYRVYTKEDVEKIKKIINKGLK